jgi:hypothetical protein
MKCSTVQERINSLVGGELPAWEAWRVKRHCALCPACRARREQTEQMLAGLRGMASMPTPERVRAVVFAQIPAIERHQDAAYHMQVSLGLDARTKRQRTLRRLIGVGGVTAVLGTSGLLIAPHVLPGFPDVRDLFDGGNRAMEQDRLRVAANNETLNSPKRAMQFLAKAKRMRELWKPWAVAQKPLMHKMLWGDKQGFAALLRLYQDLPATLPESGDGLTFRELNAGGLSFTWQPAAKLSMSSRYNPLSLRYQGKQSYSSSMVQHSGEAPTSVAVAYDSPPAKPSKTHPLGSRPKFEAQVIKTLKENYDRHHHDIELSRSISTGQTYCSLWVSGRVTETTLKTHYVGGQWELEPPMVREICPPYEEITR